MMLLLFHLIQIFLFDKTYGNIETLHFESACLQQTNYANLNLACSQYERIKIIRVIYGYSKQPLLKDCQFSIYDCIQEGTSHNILSCNGRQSCIINLTKPEMLATSITTNGVPTCPDFNYVQVNFGCIPDSKDICDQWKDEGPIIHISHTYSKDRQHDRCHCKVRSSMPNGQVLLHAREMNRQFGSLKSLLLPKATNLDCKKTTYLEIATDRSERKCMDMLPSTSNSALFGSGSHNFTLTYVKNDFYSELFFYFELKASPIKKDHNVQIICNWKRRPTTTTIMPTLTTSIITTTILNRQAKRRTTAEMQKGGKLSRADLIRHRPITEKIPYENYLHFQDTINVLTNDEEPVQQEDDEVEELEQEEEQEQEEEEQQEEQEDILPTTTTTTVTTRTTTIKTSKVKQNKSRKTSVSLVETTITTLATTTTTLSDEDEEWLRILSLADIGSQEPSKQLLSINNRTFVTIPQASMLHNDEKFYYISRKSNTLLLILVIIIGLTVIVLIAYCFKVKRPDYMKRVRTNANIAFLFCCEAAKLLFCSSSEARRQSVSISNTPDLTVKSRSYRRQNRNLSSTNLPDYQSSDYYMDEKANNFHTTQSIYDGGGGKSIYSIDYDEEETAYTTKYGRQYDGGNSISQDSLLNGENNENKIRNERPPSTTANSKISSKMSTIKSTTNGFRSLPLDEHIKLVKQKKEEAEILRLQKFQEQLRKKEAKWQQQQVERVKKWSQLRNRDSDHRLQVEERRRKREEEARAKIDELLRREKEREQNYQQRVNQNTKTNATHRPDSAMSMSTDVISTRRAISASRIRPNQQDMTTQRTSNDPSDENSTVVISPHQLNPIDEQASHDDRTNDESFISHTHRSSDRSQKRPMASSCLYWLNTGDNKNHNNTKSANFMRSTYAAKCRLHLSHSTERCPRALRARDEVTNLESPHRTTNSNRNHINDTVNRLAKPKINSMTQSVHVSTVKSSPSALPVSRSSHQIRLTNSSVTRKNTNNNRPATVPTLNTESRTSPMHESSPQNDHSASNRQSRTRPLSSPKVPPNFSKPPAVSTFSRSKPSTQRPLMTTSHSSSSLSSSTTTNKRRAVVGPLSTKSKPSPLPPTSTPSPPPPPVQQPTSPSPPPPPAIISTIMIEDETIEKSIEEETIPVNEEIMSSIEPTVSNDSSEEKPNITKREQEQKYLDEQEYQRVLNQKIREAQQRLELERQREEERKRQLELEEYEREQEQIRLAEEQHRAEQERLRRAIEERERENELKRQEELRLQQQREELERKQAEETERINRERQERAKKEEEERIERKRRLDLIMRRTRQVSPSSKQENNSSTKPSTEQTNGHNQINTNVSSPTAIMIKSSIPHSMSDNRFPTSSSTEQFIVNNDSMTSSTVSSTNDIPKFKSPLLQSLLNKARNTRSTDNLSQTSMTASQIMTESMMDELSNATKSTTSTNLYDDDQNSTRNNSTNGHAEILLPSTANLNSYHDRPMEAAAAFQ